MPLVRIDVFENELNPDQSKDLISRVTTAVAEVTSEKLRDVTWVIINEVKDDHWGVAGKPLNLNDVRKLMASR